MTFPPRPERTLRVVTLNAASLFEPGWAERRFELLAWLDRLDADIVCLQEVWERHAPDATPRERAGSPGWVVSHQPQGRWHHAFGGFPVTEFWPDPNIVFGSAVLSRWPIETSETILLPVDDRPDLPHAGYRFPCELLHVRTNDIDVCSTHLAPPPQQGYQRLTQVLTIEDHLATVAARQPRPVLPTILCGDFNTEPDADEIRFLRGQAVIDGRSTYHQEAWLAAGRTDSGFTWDGRVNPLAARLHLPPKRIDFVFVGDPFGRPKGAGLVAGTDLAFHTPLTGILASDHFGLVVDIAWPQQPTK